MHLTRLLDVLERIAPTTLAESWDNVGLLVGDSAQAITAAILTIDYTQTVADEARELSCELVIAYHPPIFHPLKRITAPSLIHDAIRRGVAIYSPHTALDVAEGGTNDTLADVLEIAPDSRGPLRLIEPIDTQCKLVTFVPESHRDRVADALFAAGAGRIGDYTSCSFQSPGTGTFFGGEGSNPKAGKAGRLERHPEIRIETVVELSKVAEVIKALRQSHPYEEPAFDLVKLSAPPRTIGQGRLGDLAVPTARSALLARIRNRLGLSHLLIAGPTDGMVRRVACAAGACGNMLDDAIAAGVELFLTGEMRHHDALRAAAAGMTVVCTLHSNSERAVLRRLKDRLTHEAGDVTWHVSQRDADPFQIVAGDD